MSSSPAPSDRHADVAAQDRHAARCKAVGDVFIACASMVPRSGWSYDDWLREVTARFKRAWKVVAG